MKQTIRTALGKLQVDPDSEDAWVNLREAIVAEEVDRNELHRLLDAARAKHRERGEWDAVASLLEVEVESAVGAPQSAAPLLAELGRVQLDELLDDRAASASFRKLLELKPNDAQVRAAIQDSETKRNRWQEMASTYLGEAQNAPDEVYKSSMLMRAAEMEL